MQRLRKSIVATAAGLGALVLLSAPILAGGDHGTGTTGVQRAHMPQGAGRGAGQPGQMGMMMNPMMGHGMMGHGMMMAPGMMMGPGMMGPGMMGPGMMGPGMMGPGFGLSGDRDLSADEVRKMLDWQLTMHGNARLKVGDVEAKDDDTIVADIVTGDGALVDRFEVDRHTGSMRRVD
jgi:hypothetical protein